MGCRRSEVLLGILRHFAPFRGHLRAISDSLRVLREWLIRKGLAIGFKIEAVRWMTAFTFLLLPYRPPRCTCRISR